MQAQSCLTLCYPVDHSPPGSSVHGILQARILGGLPCPPAGDLPNPGIEPGPPALQSDSLPSKPPGKPTGTNRPAEMTQNGELLGSLFTHQGKIKTEFLSPHQGAKTCPLV